MPLNWWAIANLFRGKANECRALALAAENAERREQYVELASMWDALVEEARRRHFMERTRSYRTRSEPVKSLGSFKMCDILCRAHVPIPPSEFKSKARALHNKAPGIAIFAPRKFPLRRWAQDADERALAVSDAHPAS